MTARFLLDTNILIFALRERTPTLRERLTEHFGRMAVSVITVAELQYGIERSSDPARNRRATDEFLSLVEVQPLSAPAAEHAGEIRAALAAVGRPIGAYDVLIAGHARAAGLTVVTNNVREFDRVPGLLVEDWSEPVNG
ncbi:type II toxin-antitoxin system tRNA(fMet)-specific endonuclease VapC [Agromyces albus]|uniref:type II toxin-antitoxin system tRNA(fMet)-specific endonuclease VapC n=1 Tax=Agromyces albus TaxID=205332 RepID=UPI0027827AA0|nr:type II toxin-antitoxin system VapC family toxin [Agromyces albus]MDQ0574324.1 tRNA(fMet)-specific endonuclease VapC [Agromyces albus]